jgi:hypothetical protein
VFCTIILVHRPSRGQEPSESKHNNTVLKQTKSAVSSIPCPGASLISLTVKTTLLVPEVQPLRRQSWPTRHGSLLLLFLWVLPLLRTQYRTRDEKGIRGRPTTVSRPITFGGIVERTARGVTRQCDAVSPFSMRRPTGKNHRKGWFRRTRPYRRLKL